MISVVNEFLDDLRGGRMTDAPIVKVEQGQLQGKLVNTPSGKGYFAFQGIPYAKPPLGSLRFKGPQPPEPWEGIRDATSEGNVSAQIDPIFSKSFIGDENCLFLNIYTPNIDGSFLPVMFYIHGGGLTYGSGNTDMYGPDFLLEKDVVVVTINYRLGPLGFLSLNTRDAPGNAGLKDVVQALRWVKENIHNFGGNSSNMTVFGESAGSRLLSVLTASPLSKNLISKAVMQSGTALLSSFTQSNPMDNATKLAKILECDAVNVDEIYEFLLTTPAKDIVEAYAKMTSFEDVTGKLPYDFTIVVEKEFLGVEAVITENVADLIKSGRIAQIPIMIGSTSLEFATEKLTDDFQNLIPQEFNLEKDSETSLAIANDIKKIYSISNEYDVLGYAALISDRLINVDNHRYVQYILHSTNIPIYIYKFDYVGELNISEKVLKTALSSNCMHCDDLGYIFKNDFQKYVEPNDQDLKMRESMVRLWTNFAKTGNPTPGEDHFNSVTWLPATKDNEYYLHLGQELTLGSNYDKEKMDFWDGLYEKYYKIWDQPETQKNEPVIVETLTVMSSSNEHTDPIVVETLTVVTDSSGEIKSTETVENVNDLVEILTQAVEMQNALIEKVETSEVVEKVNEVDSSTEVEIPNRLVEKVGTAHELVETVVNSPKAVEESLKPPEAKVTQTYLNGKSNEYTVKRTSNEIKMVQNTNGVPKDVIRANDPPEDDLPKNIGVNKFVNFFESLGGKK